MGKHLYHIELTDTRFPFVHLPDILKTCPTITQLVYSDDTDANLIIDHPLPLTHLSLSFSSKPVPFETLKSFITHCPRLTHLILHPESGNEVFTLALQSCPELTSIRYHAYQGSIMSSKEKRGISELVFPTLCQINDNTLTSALQDNRDTLEILDLRGCPSIKSLKALEGAKQLRELYLESNASFDEDELCNVMQSPSLQIVHVRSVVSVTNKVLGVLSGATTLKHLNISNCPKITGSSVRCLVDSVQGLERLILNDCHGVKPDVVNYAREKLGRNGVECRYTTY